LVEPPFLILSKNKLASTFGKGEAAGKYLDNLKRIVYHSAKYVEGLVGKHIDKDNFAKDIIQDILTGNKDFIKNISKQSAERLEMMKYDDQVLGAIKADKNAFPFVDDGTARFVVKTAAGSGVNVAMGVTKTVYCDGTNVLEVSTNTTPADGIIAKDC